MYILRHLKLEIALAIPASNDEKYKISNNSAGQGLILKYSQYTINYRLASYADRSKYVIWLTSG